MIGELDGSMTSSRNISSSCRSASAISAGLDGLRLILNGNARPVSIVWAASDVRPGLLSNSSGNAEMSESRRCSCSLHSGSGDMDIVAMSELDNRGTGSELGIRRTWCAPSIEKPCSVTKSNPRITSDEGSRTIKLCTIDGAFGKSTERQTTPTTERVSEFTADKERLRGAGKISTARRSLILSEFTYRAFQKSCN